MNSKFRYILVGLIFILIYEVYLVVYYEYEQYQTNSYVSSLEKINSNIAERNEKKQDLTLYIRTNAYQSYVAKATQNKKLPGEEVTNIVDESSVRANENILFLITFPIFPILRVIVYMLSFLRQNLQRFVYRNSIY